MKNIILLTLIIPALSACSIAGVAVGTAVKVLETAVDVVTDNDTQTTDPTQTETTVAFTAE